MGQLRFRFGWRTGGLLTARRRGADEELCLPPADDGARLGLRCGGSHVHQHHNRRGRRNRRRRVHRDAQRAMVCIAFGRVQVRHLDHGQQRQQDQAHDGNHRPGTQPGAAISAESCQKSCQTTTPCLRIHKIGCKRILRGYETASVLGRNQPPTPVRPIRLNWCG